MVPATPVDKTSVIRKLARCQSNLTDRSPCVTRGVNRDQLLNIKLGKIRREVEEYLKKEKDRSKSEVR
ncbi:hypothetical protein J6590_023013 [Homalodisca vitripennis]|nr:hypothetical protein J6590_023013 [Homalodisca vitripennis]